ncbi:unnamed protein product [Boreogadus saida]
MSRKDDRRMSECSCAAVSGAVILESPRPRRWLWAMGWPVQGQDQGPLRCGGCTLWPRQQTCLCVVPLLMVFFFHRPVLSCGWLSGSAGFPKSLRPHHHHAFFGFGLRNLV